MNFDVNDELLKKIDAACEQWGIRTRAAFFRYAAVDFLREHLNQLPSKFEINRMHQAVNRITAHRELAEMGFVR